MRSPLESFEANGVISQYEMTVRAKSSLSCPPEKYNINSTNLALKLPNGIYERTVIVHNRVGASPPSILHIPTSSSKAPVKNIRTLSKDGKLWVEWMASNNYVLKYVIEWCLVSNSSDCITEWQNEPGNVQGMYLKGPSKGPTIQTKKVGKAEAVLTWNHLTVDEQNGFIRSYTIFYKTVDGNETERGFQCSVLFYGDWSLTATPPQLSWLVKSVIKEPDVLVEVHPLSMKELLALCCGAFSRQQLRNLECIILHRLDFDLAVLTISFFLAGGAGSQCGQGGGHQEPGWGGIAELSLAIYTFTKYTPSMLAAGSLKLVDQLLRH
ncbi:hypothetical protein llap_15932 [Limosa lapponica baueri]|uniref:Uncharacterized protein n=1 Tax=Limosa lapponica baueri TaxID=1758121 RepID=A0A2I0TJ24_LIMLA|nr:hypothetical protein llap_15932 [Limosa lapponica baueri]